MRYGVTLLLLVLGMGCGERKPGAVEPTKKALTPIERYLREHFDKNHSLGYHRSIEPLPEEGGLHYWVRDSLSVKSLQATVYCISQSPDKGGCVDCDHDYVIRNNSSGACFRYYTKERAVNRTEYDTLVVGPGAQLEPINSDLLGLEAFLNERGTPTSIVSLDTVLRYSRSWHQRIRTKAQLDSICHYPEAKSIWSLYKLLLSGVEQKDVLLYGQGRLPDMVVLFYYQLRPAAKSLTAPRRHQYNLIHVRLERLLPDHEKDPRPEDSTGS